MNFIKIQILKNIIFNFIFLFYSYIFNKKLIDPECSVKDNFYNLFGLKKSFRFNFESRFETLSDEIIKTFDEKEFEILLNYMYNIVPYGSSILKRRLLNVIMLDLITCYRGWRHFRGLPTRGQRTWTNAWSVFKSNSVLRNFKLKNAKRFYGNVPSRDIYIASTAEQVNLMWKSQWEVEWYSARNSRLRFKGHPSTIKVDLFSMCNYQIMHPLKMKNMSKKQKQGVKKNYFSLGFDPGFTKYLLNKLYKTNSEDSSSSANSDLSSAGVLLRHVKTTKPKIHKKKVDEKARKIAHDEKKKKKKSVWDY